MGTITTCDRCDKKQGKDHEGWSGFRILGGHGLKLTKLQPFFTNFELCSDCAKLILPKITKILSSK